MITEINWGYEPFFYRSCNFTIKNVSYEPYKQLFAPSPHPTPSISLSAT